MSLTIRNAVKADCPRLLELIKELALFEKAPEEVTVSMQEFEDSGFGENPVWWAFVGEYEGEIIGMSLYYIRYSTWKGRRLYLEDIIITESMRGKGFGKDLLDHTIAYAKEQGYSGMMWQVLDWNTPAIDFYKKYNSKFDEEWINVNINF
ncbi:GNAT family N-acetyltransferase [Sphingobacterium sp.]|uniref:GNAT family N-acetyltransferase n=1 Tax=Sphingobacterium sp. TaxID=341027 RepID=UPI0028B20E0F|nr:GNAT family N-acetyltransferase [Sphingobacterium sp.]